MQHRNRFLNSRLLKQSACLSLLLISTSLGGCASLNKTFVAVPIKLVDIPVDVKTCLAHHVKPPKGDWTVEMVAQVVAQYRRREGELEDCLYNVEQFYTSYQRRLAQKG